MTRTLILVAAACAVLVAPFSPAVAWLVYGLPWLVVLALGLEAEIRPRVARTAPGGRVQGVLERWEQVSRLADLGAHRRSLPFLLAALAILITAIGLLQGFPFGILLAVPMCFVMSQLPLAPEAASSLAAAAVGLADRVPPAPTVSRDGRSNARRPEGPSPATPPISEERLSALASESSDELLRHATRHADAVLELVGTDPHRAPSPRRDTTVLYEMALLYAGVGSQVAREVLEGVDPQAFAAALRPEMARRLRARLGTSESRDELQRRFQADCEFRLEVSGYDDLGLAREGRVDPDPTIARELTRILCERMGWRSTSALEGAARRLYVQHVTRAASRIEATLAPPERETGSGPPAGARGNRGTASSTVAGVPETPPRA